MLFCILIKETIRQYSSIKAFLDNKQSYQFHILVKSLTTFLETVSLFINKELMELMELGRNL